MEQGRWTYRKVMCVRRIAAAYYYIEDPGDRSVSLGSIMADLKEPRVFCLSLIVRVLPSWRIELRDRISIRRKDCYTLGTGA